MIISGWTEIMRLCRGKRELLMILNISRGFQYPKLSNSVKEQIKLQNNSILDESDI